MEYRLPSFKQQDARPQRPSCQKRTPRLYSQFIRRIQFFPFVVIFSSLPHDCFLSFFASFLSVRKPPLSASLLFLASSTTQKKKKYLVAVPVCEKHLFLGNLAGRPAAKFSTHYFEPLLSPGRHWSSSKMNLYSSPMATPRDTAGGQ